MRTIAAAMVVVTALASQAQAQMRSREPSPPRFYLFGEYDYYTDSSKLKGGSAGLGWNFNRYLGLQAGAEFLEADHPLASSTAPLGVSNNVHVDSTVLYGEVKLSWPWTDRFSVYASAGGAYGDASASVAVLPPGPITINMSRSATGYRIGVGTEYWFSRHWGLRASWHQQNVGGVGSNLSAGIAFGF
ncbi:MAG TPA: porin family protein [Rhizomicrobium sp.]|nr:porin family protein [Rhizomicrobium sp.]